MCPAPSRFFQQRREAGEGAGVGPGAPASHPGIALRIPQRHLLPLGKLQPGITVIDLLGWVSVIIAFIFNYCKGSDSWGTQEQSCRAGEQQGATSRPWDSDLPALQ